MGFHAGKGFSNWLEAFAIHITRETAYLNNRKIYDTEQFYKYMTLNNFTNIWHWIILQIYDTEQFYKYMTLNNFTNISPCTILQIL